MKEIEKAYEAKKYEDSIYRQWEESGIFSPKIVKGKKPFVISMPPPNATGTLHLGHATMLAIEDIMIRHKRMQGFSALWLPGTDHASIATQNKVEKIIAEEGKTRHSMGREKFLQRVEAYVEDSRHTIRNQIRKMGSSCDWTRERFTLDQGLSGAVREVFARMYKDGLIYRGDRIVNWCTRCSSTLADDEVEFKEEKTKFYYIKYGPVVIGTARPETKFLDNIIVAHPDDKRYKKYFGKKFTVPWINGNIEASFISDKSVDPTFGSGAMTLTPAHDFIDFDLAKKHGFEVVQIIGTDGNLTSAAGPNFEGKNARSSRAEIIKILEDKDLLESVDDNYLHNVSVCYRCGTPIEPLVSKQWFVNVNKPIFSGKGKKKSLKQKALEVVKTGKIEIIPDRFNKIYYHWMNNLRDWCVSRQLWYGHRIPVWYCTEKKKPSCNKPIVNAETPKSCPCCGSKKLSQDPDTLDTWFSAGLWTFSTLGWPEKTKDLEYFHPTSVLETGYDILFFWIARMILMTTYVLHEVPFKQVYLHGLVRDRHGQKMSKSKGNGIDPLDMIEKFGTDAVRLSLIMGTSPGNDFRLYEEKIAGYRNFINKIWNSARFALLNLPAEKFNAKLSPKSIKTLSDRWILTKLQRLIKEVSVDMDKYRFSEAGMKIYDFTWGQYCDWYLEMSKGEHMNPEVLLYVLKTLLRLLHPFVPFVTESIWKNLDEKKMLIAESWPKYDSKLIFAKEEKEIEIIRELISSIRSIRSEKGVEAGKLIDAVIYCGKWEKLINIKKSVITRMARIGNLRIEKEGKKITNSIWKYINGIHLYIPVSGLVDMKKETERINRKIAEIEARLVNFRARLKNPDFLSKAPPELIQKEKDTLSGLEKELANLEQKIKEMKSIQN